MWEPVSGGTHPDGAPTPTTAPPRCQIPCPHQRPLCPRGAAQGRIQMLLLHQQTPRGALLAGRDPREKPRAHQGPRTPLPSLLGSSPALTLPGYRRLMQPQLRFIRHENHETTGACMKFPVFPPCPPTSTPSTATITPGQRPVPSPLAPGQVSTPKSGVQQAPTLQTPCKTKGNGSGSEEGRQRAGSARRGAAGGAEHPHLRNKASSPQLRAPRAPPLPLRIPRAGEGGRSAGDLAPAGIFHPLKSALARKSKLR